MENRELTKAKQYLSDRFVMTFPGSGELTSLEQLVEWARGRYRFVQKTITAVNVAYEMETTLVFVHARYTASGRMALRSKAFDS